jgi:flagellar hook-length control protein FliK
LQTSVNPASGNAAPNKVSAQTVLGNGTTAKSFTDELSQTLNGDSSTLSSGETTGLAALLQGLSPALLMALLTPGQADKLGTSPSGGKELDPAIIKALQSLNEQSDALNQLINSGAFQQWLSKVSELLASMNANVAAAPVSSSGVESLQDSTEQALPKTAAQAQAIVNQFMSALSQNKDSLLFQQLVESFQEIVSPVLAAQAAPKAMANSTKGLNGSMSPEAGSKSDSLVGLQGTVQTILGALTASDASATKETVSDLSFKLQLLQGNKQFSKLDALTAKSGMADRMMLAALQSGIGTDETTKTDVLSLTNSLPFQDLTRMLQTAEVKSVQPMTAQSFVQDMSQFVLKNFKADALNGFSEARLTLSPENLGQVNVKLTMHNGQLVAHFAAQTLLGKEMLEGQLSQLKLSLQGQGLQVERLEVTQSSSLQSSLFQDQRQQQFSQQFARQNKSSYSNLDSVPESFSVEMANLAKLSNAYGNAFDVTA